MPYIIIDHKHTHTHTDPYRMFALSLANSIAMENAAYAHH